MSEKPQEDLAIEEEGQLPQNINDPNNNNIIIINDASRTIPQLNLQRTVSINYRTL